MAAISVYGLISVPLYPPLEFLTMNGNSPERQLSMASLTQASSCQAVLDENPTGERGDAARNVYTVDSLTRLSSSQAVLGKGNRTLCRLRASRKQVNICAVDAPSRFLDASGSVFTAH